MTSRFKKETTQSGSHYLADLNNEREFKNETYKEVLANLENLVLVMWDDDTTIVPKVVKLQIKSGITEVHPIDENFLKFKIFLLPFLGPSYYFD